MIDDGLGQVDVLYDAHTRQPITSGYECVSTLMYSVGTDVRLDV